MGKNFNNSLKIGPNVLVPGSEIRDPGSGMGKNQDPGSGINIPDPQHCENPLKKLDCGAQMGGRGESEGRREGAELEGENKRGGGTFLTPKLSLAALGTI